jgi:3-oxoacyl-[acyl-carrier-protein] synthase-3
MQILELSGIGIGAIYSCLPKRSEDNLARCREVYGDEKKALSVVKATGIKSRRVVEQGTSSLDLCVAAAERLIADTGVAKEDIGAVIDVTFTPERTMPCNACQAQRRLKLPTDIAAFDINLACSGWAYGLFVAGQFAKATGKMVLLLDGDTQTPYMDDKDVATVPVMADAGTATLVSPSAEQDGGTWKFAFLTNGAKGDTLTLPFGGKISMDGLGIFKFVTMDVLYLIRDFMAATGETPETIDAFVPHQANVFMIQQIAKKLKFPAEKLWVSGDVFGNSSSATVPTTIAHCGGQLAEGSGERLLVSGFGGGLSASVGLIDLSSACKLRAFDYEA